jgi:hypothetical protein
MISMFIFLLIIGIGILGIILSVDFFDYLSRFESKTWEEITFERPFGIPRQDFFFYPIKPHKFCLFIFSTEDWDSENIHIYKKKLKLVIVSFSFFLLISFFIS